VQTFKLTIRLGNAEMQDGQDISDVFDDVAADLSAGRTRGCVKDVNGNTVGEWSLL